MERTAAVMWDRSTTVWMVAFFGGLLAFLQCLKVYPPHLNDDPLVWELPLGLYGAGLLLTVVFWKNLKNLFVGPPPFPGASVLAILFFSFPIVTVGTLAFFFCNGFFDSSAAIAVHYSVIQKHRYGRDYSLEVQEIQNPPFLNSIAVNEETYSSAHIGSTVDVEVKNGYLKVPWIVKYSLEK